MILLELATQASRAIDTAKAAIKKGEATTPEAVAPIILEAVKGWKPKIKGHEVLTPTLRAKLAGALGHLAFNLYAAETGKAPV